MSILKHVNDTTEASQVELPEGIVAFLQKKNRITKQANTRNYSVTDIVSCKRKVFYKQSKIPEEELEEAETIENMWGMVRGDLLHKMTYAYNWRELDILYPILLKDGRTVFLSGRLDMYDWQAKKIIDLKTTKFVKWQIKQGFIPKVEHILQVKCYYTMFSKRLPIEDLNIVYVDMNDLISYRVPKTDLSEWIKTRIQEIENALLDRRIPDGETSGICKYCKYQTRCHSDGKGLIDRPLSVPMKYDSTIANDTALLV